MNTWEEPISVDVVCALLERDGKLLVAQRPQGKALAGKWEFPGGKMEPGETASEAIVREIREELACGVKPIRALEARIHCYANTSITLHPIICELYDGEPRPLEHARIEWVDASALHEWDLADADVPVVRDYIEDSVRRKKHMVFKP